MKGKAIILVVDDQKETIELFRKILKNEDCTILTTNNGKEALRLVDRKRPTLVILDLRMPDMSGIEVLRRIKRVDEDIEVIVTTAYGTMKTARIVMKLGAFDYVTKPFDTNCIRDIVADALLPASENLVQLK